MIFSNKIYKTVNGKSPSLYASSQTNMDLYISSGGVNKYIVSTENGIRIDGISSKFDAMHVCKIDDEYLCLCHTCNMSIVK